MPGLDIVLCGGFWQGSVTIVQGTPGAGKTILANQICFAHARHGGRCLYLTLLAESHDQLLANLATLSFYDESLVSDSIFYVSAFSTVQLEGLKGLLRLMLRERERREASLVVLDGIFALSGTDDSEAELRRIINELGNLASITRTTILLLTNSSRGAGSPEYTMVDGWVQLGHLEVDYRSFRFFQVHKSRGSNAIPGQHQSTVTEEGYRVFPRLESLPGPNHRPVRNPKLTTGIAELDTMLGGGIDASAMGVIGGPTGVGKTSIGLHFVSQCSREEPGLIFGFYEDQDDLLQKGRSMGLDLEALCKEGALEVLWFPPVEALIDELAHRLLETVRRRRIRRLLVDGMEAFRQAALYPARLGRFFTALTNELRSAGVTTLFTVELSTQDALQLPLPIAPVSAVAEYIVVLRYAELGSEIKRTVTIRKCRRSSFDPRVREFGFADRGIVIGDPVDISGLGPGQGE